MSYIVLESGCHLVTIHGSGAATLMNLTGHPRKSIVLPKGGTSGRRFAQGLKNPLAFDGNVSEQQDLRFSFRIHMSLVSSVSQTLMTNA